MAGERPAFTLESGRRPTVGLPLEGWGLAMAAFGALLGAAVAHLPTPCPATGAGCAALLPQNLAVPLLSCAAAAGAVAWFALPVREDREAVVRGAVMLALAGGAATLVAGIANALVGGSILAAAAIGLGAPLAMLSALRPEAALEWGSRRRRKTFLWLRAGAVGPCGAAFGFALGWILESGFLLGGTPPIQSPTGQFPPPGTFASPGAVLAGAFLLAAGLAVLALGNVAGPTDSAEARPSAARVRMLARMTPMLRFDFFAEVGLAVAVVAALAALLSTPWATDRSVPVTALTLGGVTGAVIFMALGPTLDFALGRGRFLAVAPLAGAAFPLLVGASLPGLAAFALFAAALVWGFAASTAPQRFALTFDLAPSRGRLRAAADLHGTKLLAAALAPWAYWALEGLSSGIGLLAASLLALIAFAFFAPTLGGLGRRQG